MRLPPVAVRQVVGYPVLAVKRRLLARFRRELAAVREVQARRLAALLAASEGSAFARDHGLARVRTPEDLRAALPIAGYERMAPYVERVMAGEVTALFRPGTEVVMFATTSGTTSASKHIPVTRASLAEYRESWTIWGCAVAETHPRLPYGGVVNLASPWRAARAPSGVPCGSITGLLLDSMHRTLRITNAVPPAVALVDDAATRQYLALRLALARPDVMMVTTANPSTLLGFARRMHDWQDELLRDIHDGGLKRAAAYSAEVLRAVAPHLGRRPALARALAARAREHGALHPVTAWPELTLLGVWTGGTLSSYLAQLPLYYGDVPLRDHGLSASEGRVTLPLMDGTSSGVVDVHGAYFEFVPEGEAGRPGAVVKGAHELDVGGRYEVVLTTSGGLFRYDLADVVECTGHDGPAPLLRFLNKRRDIANVTGEKLSAHQVAEGLGSVQRALGLVFGDCVVAPAFGDPALYHLLLEEGALPSDDVTAALAAALDQALCELNVEYADKRRSGRLGGLAVTAVADGTFARLRAARLAATGGAAEQYKHPFLVPDLDFVATHRLPRPLRRTS